MRATKGRCFVKELLVEKCVKKLLATYLEYFSIAFTVFILTPSSFDRLRMLRINSAKNLGLNVRPCAKFILNEMKGMGCTDPYTG